MLRRALLPTAPLLGAAAAWRGQRRLAQSQPSPAPLSGKRALVTGSTSGIGLSVAEALASQGCDLVLNGFGEPAEIQSLEREFAERYGVKAVHVGADLTKPEEVRSLVTRAQEELGGVDILVNNAGMQNVSPIVDFPEQKWDQLIALNLSATFHATKACLPAMTERGYGRIVNISSAHGKVASVNKAAYCAAKHGVIGLTKVTALETAGTGVTANAVCPGWVLTPLVRKQIEMRAVQSGRSVDDETTALVSEKMPSGQPVRPEHLGQMVAFLCSEAGEQITGAELLMDGGWTAQ